MNETVREHNEGLGREEEDEQDCTRSSDHEWERAQIEGPATTLATNRCPYDGKPGSTLNVIQLSDYNRCACDDTQPIHCRILYRTADLRSVAMTTRTAEASVVDAALE